MPRWNGCKRQREDAYRLGVEEGLDLARRIREERDQLREKLNLLLE